MKHAGTAAVLSFVFSGLGQLYNGQILKGLVIIFFTGLSLLFITVGAVLIYAWIVQPALMYFLWAGICLFAVGIIAVCIIGIFSIVDAYKCAVKNNNNANKH